MSAWWRIWIPTWRFFDQPGDFVRLEVWHDGAWHSHLNHPPRRRWWSLFYNPGGNLYLARRNQIDRAAAGSLTDLRELAKREGRFRLLVKDEVIAEQTA